MSLNSAHAPLLPGGAAPEHGAAPEDDGGPWGVLTAVAVTALGPVSFGYVIGFSSPAAAPLLASGLLTAAQLSVFEALSPLGAIAGAAGAGVAADTVGRTRALALCCVPFATGWLLIALAESVACLYAGRLLTGVGVGCVLNIVPVYVAEIAPPSMRGGLIGVNQLAINSGVVLAFALGLPAAGLSWRALSAAALAPLAVLATGALLVPESPRWLASAGRGADAAAALRALRRRADVSAELRSIQAGLAAAAAEPAPSFADFVARPALARPLRIVLVFMLLQQLTGINCVFFNVAPIFAAAGLRNADAAALAVMAPQLLISAAACVGMDAAGRRPLLLWACAIMALAAAALGVSFMLPAADAADAHRIAIGATLLFVSAFSVGMGPIPWVLMGELFPSKVRGIAASVATVVSNLAAFSVTATFAPLVASLGMGSTFFLYALFCAVAWAFTFTSLPETKGRSLEQIGALLAADVNPWDAPPPPPPEADDEAPAGAAEAQQTKQQ